MKNLCLFNNMWMKKLCNYKVWDFLRLSGFENFSAPLRNGPPMPCVGCVCCWFSPLLRGFFSGFSGFPSTTKTNIFKFVFDQEERAAWKPAKTDVVSFLNIPIFYSTQGVEYGESLFNWMQNNWKTNGCFQNSFKTTLALKGQECRLTGKKKLLVFKAIGFLFKYKIL